MLVNACQLVGAGEDDARLVRRQGDAARLRGRHPRGDHLAVGEAPDFHRLVADRRQQGAVLAQRHAGDGDVVVELRLGGAVRKGPRLHAFVRAGRVEHVALGGERQPGDGRLVAHERFGLLAVGDLVQLDDAVGEPYGD